MLCAQKVLACLGVPGRWVSIDDLTRMLDIERVQVRAALLKLHSRGFVEMDGDRWRTVESDP